MPLSNSTQNILRSSPYWDDYNRSKRFHRILIKPKTPVQTRELNQMQSMLQNQVEQMTSSIYREGAAVSGGQQVYSNNAAVIQVVRNDAVDIRNFYNAENAVGALAEGQSSAARAIVTQVSLQPTAQYAAILFAPLNALQFTPGESVAFLNANNGEELATLTVAPGADATNVASTFSVNDGVFYLRGHLIDVPKQTVILGVGTNAPSKRVGFTISETIVTSSTDATLLDPALGTTNYAAPGADRLRLSAVLTAKDINDDRIALNSDEGFIELVRIIDGVIQPKSDRLQSEFVEDTLARRTNDESGDYVVRPFRLLVKEHNPPLNVPNITGRVTGNTSSNTVLAANVITSITLANGFTCNVTTLFDSEVMVGDVLVVNGEGRTVTSILSNTALRVNTAYTQEFINATATVVSGEKLNIELESGKAYVRGYEIENTGTLKLAANRPRTTQAVNNGRVSTGFGPYVLVTHNRGLFNVNSLELVDLHSVPFGNVNTSAANTTSGAYFSTKIGTARARSFVYHTGVGDSDTVYRLYLVDAGFETKNFVVNTTPNAGSDTQLASNNVVAAVVVDASAKTIKLRQNAASAAAATLSFVNDTYIGATIKLYTKAGNQLFYSISNSANTYTSAGIIEQTLTLQNGDNNLLYVNTTANVQIIFTDKSIRSITNNGNTKNKGVTTSILSKTGRIEKGNTVLFGTNATPLLFRYREGVVKPSTITDENYEVLRYVESVTGTETPGGSGNIVFTISPATTTLGSNEAPYPLGPDTEHQYLTAVLSSNGAVIPLEYANGAVSLAGRSIDIGIPQSNIAGTPTSTTANFYLRTTVDDATARTKTIYTANTNVASVTVNSSGHLISNVAQYAGHIAINNITSSSDNIVGLGIADVYQVEKVYAVKDANTIATNAAAIVDVTDNYTLDTGQRNWAYLHSSIALKPGRTHYTINASQMLVMVNRYHHSTAVANLAYFNPSSYTELALENIPTFTDPKTGENYRLANFVDFRPVQTQNLTSANTATNPYKTASSITFDTSVLPHPSALYQADYEYYLPRIDKVVLTKDRQFRIITGTPSSTPTIPADDPNGITLYVLSYPAYTAYPELVNIRPFEYRRYTMKDIRRLEKRIENLEYYAALSTMDIQTLNSPEEDKDGNPRYKNGIVTDNFTTDGVVSFVNSETTAALDHRLQELRPRALVRSFNLEPEISSTVERFGDTESQLLSLPYTSIPFITQGLASKSINPNPFNLTSWIGSMSLYPSSDTWIDRIAPPDLVTNLFNENDGVRDSGDIETTYNYWETTVIGIDDQKSAFNNYLQISDPNNPYPEDQWQVTDNQFESLEGRLITASSQTIRSTETVFTHTKVSALNQDSGNRIVDTSIVPKMRGRDIDIAASGLLPGASLRAIFDEVDVTAYVERANRITIDVDDVDTFGIGDTITTAAGGRGRIVGIISNAEEDKAYLFVVDAEGIFEGSSIDSRINLTRLVPETTVDVTVESYQHWHGKLTGITSDTNTTTGPWKFTLDAGAPTSADYYTDKVIHFTDGGSLYRVDLATRDIITENSGVGGFKGIITAYDSQNQQITVSNIPSEYLTALLAQKTALTTWNAIRYTIGNLETNADAPLSPGSFFGMFRLPGMRTPTDDPLSSRRYDRVQSSELQFNIGSRVFRLKDDGTTNTTTSASTGFSALGSTSINDISIVRTRQLNVWQAQGGSTVTRTNDSAQTLQKLNSYERTFSPLAQTFIVNGEQYPDGIFVTQLDLFFANKGTVGLDVIVELRPTVDGYPSLEHVLATAKLSSGDIKAVPSGVTPSPGNSLHYTRFTFNTPTYLAPDVDYCITVITNSNEYELFVGELGQKVLGTTTLISEQPHGGVLFKPQNARVSVPEPSEDLMFVLHRAEFEMRESNAVFQLTNSYASLINNTVFDAAYLNFDYLDFAPTSPYTKFYLSTVNQSDVVSTTQISNRTNIELSERMVVSDDTSDDVRVVTTMRTTTPHVSPILDTQRANILLIRNAVDNGRLYANGFVFTPGTPNPAASAAYSVNGNAYALTISGGNGTGAQFYAVTNSSGYVVRIASAGETVSSGVTTFTSNGGYDFTETPAISMTLNTHFNTQPTFSYIGETSAKSHVVGEEKARYVTRTISLADGFDASDLKVYLTAMRSPQHDIDVYYKVLATGDPQRFDEKQWVRMKLRDDLATVYSASSTDRKEYEYRTLNDKTEYTSNGTTFDRFHSFAIKIVLRSQLVSNPYFPDTTIVPRVSNLRVLALDE